MNKTFVALYANNPKKYIDAVTRNVMGIEIIPFGDMESDLKVLTYKNVKLDTMVILGSAFTGKSVSKAKEELVLLRDYLHTSPTTTVTFLHNGVLSELYVEVLGQFTQCTQYTVNSYSTVVIGKLLYLEEVDIQNAQAKGNTTNRNLASDALKNVKVQKEEAKEPLFTKKVKKKTAVVEQDLDATTEIGSGLEEYLEPLVEPEPEKIKYKVPEPPKKVKPKVQKAPKPVKEPKPIKEPEPEPIKETEPIEDETEYFLQKKKEKEVVHDRFTRGIITVTGDRRSGKSTLAKLVAEKYSRKGLQTILIDLNTDNRILSQCFGEFGYKTKCRNGLYFTTLNPSTIDENILPITDTLYYLGTSETLDTAEERHLKQNLDENLFSSLIQVASKLYDVVVVDCPFDVMKRNPALVSTSTTILWTSGCDNSGIKITLDILLHQFYEDIREYNFFLSKLVIVLNNDIDNKGKDNWLRYYNSSEDAQLEAVCEKCEGIVPHISNYDKKFWKSETETAIVKMVEPFLNRLL